MSKLSSKNRREWLSVTLSADQNNYNPNIERGPMSVLRVTCSGAPRQITGLTGGKFNHAREFTIINVGANALTLKNASGSSSAENRFNLGADLVLAQYDAVTLIYDDDVLHSWALSSTASAAGGGLSAVVTDDTLTGDGTEGSPLTTQGGAGAPVDRNFSTRGVSNLGGTTQYFPLAEIGSSGAGGVNDTDPTNTGNTSVQFATIFRQACSLSDLLIRINDPVGLGESLVYTVMVDGAATAITCSIAGDVAVTGEDTTHSASVPAGALVAIRVAISANISHRALTGVIKVTPTP